MIYTSSSEATMDQKTPPPVATGWQHLYSVALSEPDHEKRYRLIRKTEQAIGDRYYGAGRDLAEDEICEMAAAVWTLLQLRRGISSVP